MLNSIQLFGCLLVGGLLSGETTRRCFRLPRTTGYVLFGLLLGQSGLGWIKPEHIESACLFIDLALGLILFELGHRISNRWRLIGGTKLCAGLAESLISGAVMFAIGFVLGFPPLAAAFAAAIGISTSPAITVATSADVGARGPRTETLFTLVAVNGTVAFVLVSLASALSSEVQGWHIMWRAFEPIVCAVLIGGLGGWAAVVGARKLGHYAEHQHLLLLGLIVLAVGSAIALKISVLLPLLLLGVSTRLLDRHDDVVAIRISSDARIFLVITFVLAGAAQDIGLVANYWGMALVFVVGRAAGKFIAVEALHRQLGLDEEEGKSLAVGLMPMSSVALVLVLDMGALHAELPLDVQGMLLTAVFLMQLLGPLFTQYAIRKLGEATLLAPKVRRPYGESAG